LLEPNAKPGLTNRLLAPLVDEVWGAFPEADDRFRGKYVHTGSPYARACSRFPTGSPRLRGSGSRRNTGRS